MDFIENHMHKTAIVCIVRLLFFANEADISFSFQIDEIWWKCLPVLSVTRAQMWELIHSKGSF